VHEAHSLELETQITIASELEYLDDSDENSTVALASQTGRLLNGLIGAFEERVETGKIAV
jgi:hypothetical protein